MVELMIMYILFLPLTAAIFTGLLCKKVSNSFAQIFNSSLLVISALLSLFVFYDIVVVGKILQVDLFNWIDFGNFTIKWSIYADSLTAIMLVVVTIISSIVHIYSIGYMHDDPNVPKFMAYLSLFTFFMLMLVTSNNLVQLFFGWEGVGLCSYLLIGFWYQKQSACDAAVKAFVVNRVGDVFFAIGIFSIFFMFDSVAFDQIFANVAVYKDHYMSVMGMRFHTLDFVCILLFIGCMGKSAQIGLHTWLPDAMEGPTPVSALIHAATMVTAGVFLVARCSPLFEYAPFALDMVTVVGAVTCVFAATIALVQNDIKKIVAYSTCSQLGYMFFACGVSAYPAAIFHLFTHAFFKALLFLGAGSVIHALSGEQDITKMGGLWKKIPFTYAMMWVGSLALCGIWPFAGYYSKDAIIEAAYLSGSGVGEYAFSMGVFAACCTAFYSIRLLILVFHGTSKVPAKLSKHIHEPSLTMIVPLALLSLGAVFSGVIGDKIFYILSPGLEFWHNSITILAQPNILEKIHHLPISIKITPLVAGVGGMILAYIFYITHPNLPKIIAARFSWLYVVVYNKYYVDELYDVLIVHNLKRCANYFANTTEVKVIDGFGPNGFASVVNRMSGYFSKLQTGYLYHYALVMLLGFVIFLTWYMLIFA
jgi:NADH-quinone oxidoreductase subunit L